MRNFILFFVKIDKLIPIFMQKCKTKNSPNFFEKGEQKWISYTIWSHDLLHSNSDSNQYSVGLV